MKRSMKRSLQRVKRRPTLPLDSKLSRCFLAAVVLAAIGAGGIRAFQAPAPAVNADSVVLADFTSRIKEYMKLRKKASDTVQTLKPTKSQAKIKSHEQQLAHEIREAREKAHQGDIFTPEISAVFRHLIVLAGEGPTGVQMKQSLRRAEPVNLTLRVNRPYPDGFPLQSSPPTLLANLPPLPKELDYRIVGQNLILRDTEANLIIDFVNRVFP